MSAEERGEDAGGDPACWAHLLCPECGAVLGDPRPVICPRCEAPVPDEPD